MRQAVALIDLGPGAWELGSIIMLNSLNFKQAKSYADFMTIVAQYCIILLGFAIPITAAGNNIFFYLLLIIFIIGGAWGQKYYRIKQNTVALTALSLSLLLVIGLSYTMAPSHMAVLRLSKYAKLLLIPILIAQVSDNKIRKYGLYAFMIAIAINFVFGLLRFITGFDIMTMSMVGGPDIAVFIGHIELNAFMAFTAFVCAVYALYNKKFRWLFVILMLGAMYYVLYMSIARSGYIVLAALFGLLILHLLFKKFYKLATVIMILGFLIAGAAILTSPMIHKRFMAARSDMSKFDKGYNETSVGARLCFYQHSLRLIAQNPAIGSGTGSFASKFKTNWPNNIAKCSTVNPHNQYIDFTMQLGVLGLFVFLFLLYSAWRNKDKPFDHSKLLLHGVITTIVVGSFINSWIMDLHIGFFFCYFVGLWVSSDKDKA